MTRAQDHFPTETSGLPVARATEEYVLADGQQFDLRIAPVAKRLGDATLRMLAYNGSIPGPSLRVRQGSQLFVNVVNEGDLEATVHWHGLRLENRFDGTAATQRPMPVGGSFIYKLDFPDPGVYWYHPHVREDYGQEMGLYGNIVVVPSEPDYWPAVNRELTIVLDDILLEGGKVAPFRRAEPTYAAMGRFGNVFMINGETALSLTARHGEVVRVYVTNTANTRVFNTALRGAQMKLVGGDSGHYEHEKFVDHVVVAPSERVVIDVLFDKPGPVILEHVTPAQAFSLGTFTVTEERAVPSLTAAFATLRTNVDMKLAREGASQFLKATPDKTLALVAEMAFGEPAPLGASAVFACPMHPEIRSDQAGRCPKCGMKLLPAQFIREAEHGTHEHGHPHDREHSNAHDVGKTREELHGIEWEDDMVQVNRLTTPANMQWKLIDRATGAEGAAIDWLFRVGDRVKIRIVNEMDSDHPMHHPFHIHGAGRFLILARDGVVEPNLVWKDTVLVPTGQTVDILLDVTNPGRWMAHCHIAEHHESGMMFSFSVDP